jgi:hypothetical protein
LKGWKHHGANSHATAIQGCNSERIEREIHAKYRVVQLPTDATKKELGGEITIPHGILCFHYCDATKKVSKDLRVEFIVGV